MIDFTNCPVDRPWILRRDGEDESVLITTEAQLAYARLNIARNGDEGYYLVDTQDDKGYPTKYYINHYGVVEDWPVGLFDAYGNMAGDILRAGIERKESEQACLRDILEFGLLSDATHAKAKTMRPVEAIKYLKSEIGYSCSLYEATQYWKKFVRKEED